MTVSPESSEHVAGKAVLAKIGLDGHDVGILLIARALSDAGAEVVYLGKRNTPETVVRAVIEEDAALVGLSSLTGSLTELAIETKRLLDQRTGRRVDVVVGGIVDQEEQERMERAGIARCFLPETPITSIAAECVALMQAQENPTDDTAPEPRVRPIESPSPETRALLDKTLSREGTPLNIFLTLAHHPLLLRRVNALGGVFLQHGTLDPQLRESVILRVAYRSRCEYEFGQHAVIAGQAGMSTEQVRQAAVDPEGIASSEVRAAVRLADRILDGEPMTDELWDAATEGRGEDEALELVALVGYYRMIADLLRTVGVQREAGTPGWDEISPPPAAGSGGDR